jgi:arabinogalactan endo-1,4-beta-galactosidase
MSIRSKLVVYGCHVVLGLACQQAHAQSFYKGVDLSYVNQMEDCGAGYTVSGSARDPFQTMADHEANLVRVRLWHNPSDYTPFPTTYSSFDDAKIAIQRAKSNGMQVLLDFHYSDTFADPGKQIIPAAWTLLVNNTTALATEVNKYTAQVLADLAAMNLAPEFVQLGNEINGNMLRLQGENLYPVNWSRQSTLLNAAIDAVRDHDQLNDTYTNIVLHVANPSSAASWFSNATNNGIEDFDIIGLSYYPAYHGQSIAQVGDMVETLKADYKKNVLIVETGVPWTTGFNDNANNIINEIPTAYAPPSPTAQRDWLTDLTTELLDHSALGSVFWEPAWVSTSCQTEFGMGSNWENLAFYDFNDALITNGGVQFLEQLIPVVESFKAAVTDQGGAWGNGLQGQAFKPRENATPNPGVPRNVYLTQMEFIQGGNPGGGVGIAVDIYRANATTLAEADLIGRSTNTLDTTAPNGTVYTFNFDKLPLDFNEIDLAIFKDASEQPVGLGLLQGWEGSASIDDYEGGGAIFNYDAYGWTTDTNTDFSASFSTAAPEEPEGVNVPMVGWPGLILLFGMLGGIATRKSSVQNYNVF